MIQKIKMKKKIKNRPASDSSSICSSSISGAASSCVSSAIPQEIPSSPLLGFLASRTGKGREARGLIWGLRYQHHHTLVFHLQRSHVFFSFDFFRTMQNVQSCTSPKSNQLADSGERVREGGRCAMKGGRIFSQHHTSIESNDVGRLQPC